MGERIFTAAEKHAALERELRYRRHVYSRRVAENRMTQKLADEQIAIFEAMAMDYAELSAKERLL